MELESLFTASKWEILQHLSETPLSPLQLAERSSTTLANVSQQLRLLEMAGLVTSERISNRDKGQPRILYSLAGDQGYFIAATSDFAEKKLCKLTAYNKVILKIWFYDNPTTRYLLEKAFWQIEHLLPKITNLSVAAIEGENILLRVSGESISPKELPILSLTTPDGKQASVSFELNGELGGHQLYARDRVHSLS